MPDLLWYQHEIHRLERSGDRLSLLRLALQIVAERPSAGLVAQAGKLFPRHAEECFRLPFALLRDPAPLQSLIDLLQQGGRHPEFAPEPLDRLYREALLLLGFEALSRQDTRRAGAYFEQATAGEGIIPSGAPAGAELLRTLGQLQTLMRRGFPVFEPVCRLYEEAYPSAPLLGACRSLLDHLRRDIRPLPLDRAGQVGALLALRHPGLGTEFGRVARISVTAEPADTGEIAFAPALAERVERLAPSLGQRLAAVAEQAASVAQRLLGRPMRVVWDVDLADELITGPSLGLGLVLGILSARTGQPLPEGLTVTGTVNLVGDVGPVGQLEAKGRAALWQGGRLLLLPTANVEADGISSETAGELSAAGVVVHPVRNVAEACQIVLPDTVSPPRGSRTAAARPARPLFAAAAGCGIAAALGFGWVARSQNVRATQTPARRSPPIASTSVQATNPNRPILRMRHFVADGDFVLDAVARGEYKKLFKFEKEPLVLDNDVLRLMRRIRRDYFLTPHQFEELHPHHWVGVSAVAALPRSYPGIQRFRKLPEPFTLSGEVTRREYRLPKGDDPLFYQESIEPRDSIPDHPALLVHRRAIPSLVARRPFMQQDRLSRALMLANPRVWDLVDLSVYLGEPALCGEGYDSPGYVEDLKIRPLKLVFVDVENVGNSPALNLRYGLRAINPPANELFNVRTLSDTEASLGQIPIKQATFPYETLKPGEHVLVPTAVGLGGIDEDDIDSRPDASPDRSRPYGFYYDLSHPLAAFHLPYHQAYLFGPVLRITDFDYDDPGGNTYHDPMRPPSEQRIQVTNLVGSGSCPFVFCLDNRSATWVNTGSVLVGHRSPDRPGHDTRRLAPQFRRIQLRELEEETSFIDAAQLEVKGPNGRSQYLPAHDPRLRARDGRALILHQGESFELRFDGEASSRGERILHLWGYYIPKRGGPRENAAALHGDPARGTGRRR